MSCYGDKRSITANNVATLPFVFYGIDPERDPDNYARHRDELSHNNARLAKMVPGPDTVLSGNYRRPAQLQQLKDGVAAHWEKKGRERREAEVFVPVVRTAIDQAVDEYRAVANIAAGGQLVVDDGAFTEIHQRFGWQLARKLAEPSDTSVRDVGQIVRDDPGVKEAIAARFRELIRLSAPAQPAQPVPAPPGRFFRVPPIPTLDGRRRRKRRRDFVVLFACILTY